MFLWGLNDFSFTKPCKELYWYIQPTIFSVGLCEYGQNKQLLFNYEKYFANGIFNTQTIKLEQLDILLPNVITLLELSIIDKLPLS